MADTLNRLSFAKVARIKAPGMYADGGGLYLQVTASRDGGAPAKSWIYRYKLERRAREMGLGSLKTLSLADARAKAAECRKLRLAGIDPITHRETARAAARLEASRAVTFKQCALDYIETHRHGWRNAKHAAQWRQTLETYAFPKIGELPVQSIDTHHVTSVLQQDQGGKPLWIAKPETASRLRGRIETILDAARVLGVRASENPARWRGHLDKLLPARAKVRQVKHHPALPYDDLPAFMQKLRAQPGTAARALEFTILNASRTAETIGARGAEIDGKVWTVPPERMKAGKEHRVPLSDAALRLVRDRKDDPEALLFPSIENRDRPLSNMAMAMLLRRMGDDAITVHGFRSTFRDWAAERTNYANYVVEMALAHAIESKVEGAYRRGDLFEKRCRLMDDWAKFCASKPAARGGEVVNLRSNARGRR